MACPLALRPDTYYGPQQCTLSGTRGPGNQHRLTSSGGKGDASQERRAIRKIQVDPLNGNPNFRMTDEELTRFARCVMNSGEPLTIKIGRPLVPLSDASTPKRDIVSPFQQRCWQLC
jgi:hypothetical protein